MLIPVKRNTILRRRWHFEIPGAHNVAQKTVYLLWIVVRSIVTHVISRLPRCSFGWDHVQLLIIVAEMWLVNRTQRSIHQQWFWWPADPQQVALRAGDNLIWQRWLNIAFQSTMFVFGTVLSNCGWVMPLCSCTNCQCVTGTPINQRSTLIS